MKAPQLRPKHKTIVVALLISSLVAAVFSLLLNAARLGPGITNDSVAYASASRSFAGSGHLVDFTGTPLTTFPAGLPVLLGMLERAGFDLEKSAVALNLLCACVGVWIMYAIAFEFVESTYLALGCAALFGLSASTVRIYSMLWTEPIFCALTALSLLIMVRAIRSNSISPVRIAAICGLVSAACLFRYVGVILIPFAAIGVYISLRGPHRMFKACAWALTAGLLSSAGFQFAGIRNRTLGVGMMGTRDASDSSLGSVLLTALNSVGGLIFPMFSVPLRLVVGLACVLILLYGIWRIVRSKRAELLFVASYVACYSLALLYSEMRTVIDPIDERLLAPIIPLCIIIIVYGIHASQVKAERALAAGALVLIVWTAGCAVNYSVKAGRDGVGLNNWSYRTSPLVQATSAIAPSAILASTNPEFTYWFSKRTPVLRIPRHDHYFPTKRVEREFSGLNRATHFVFLKEDATAFTPEEVEHKAGLHLVLWGSFSDGRIYQAVP